MRNKYKSVCDKCWKSVKPDGGEVMRLHGRWITRHDACVDLEKDSLLRATLARKGDEELAAQEPCESYDTSQMNLKFERSKHGTYGRDTT